MNTEIIWRMDDAIDCDMGLLVDYLSENDYSELAMLALYRGQWGHDSEKSIKLDNRIKDIDNRCRKQFYFDNYEKYEQEYLQELADIEADAKREARREETSPF